LATTPRDRPRSLLRSGKLRTIYHAIGSLSIPGATPASNFFAKNARKGIPGNGQSRQSASSQQASAARRAAELPASRSESSSRTSSIPSSTSRRRSPPGRISRIAGSSSFGRKWYCRNSL